MSPDDATPFPGAPRFFRRVWDPGPPGRRDVGPGVAIITPSTPLGGLVIYGFSARSTYVEDHRLEEEAWEHTRSFPGYCFSEVEPRGEWGFTPIAEVEEITREEFDLAQSRGFK